MEKRDKIKIAITIASLAAISIFFTLQSRKRRKQKCSPSSCYLQTDQKPQHYFRRLLADNSYSPFKHANHEKSSSLHPCEVEIKALLENPRREFDFVTDDVDLKMSDSYVWVETTLQLKELADALSRERVFAVDTEQHSLRSFLGFTALVQISTDKDDYLVDTIALHDEMSILRPVFADPSICKVFHGADNDVLWLQRDFHIYVVNLFDTAKACEVLSKPQKSLAYLLETYCGVATNKMLQREDWRQRPLSTEMVQYAQTDAHYLLHIARCLVGELKQLDNENSSCPGDKFNPVLEASRRSNTICLQLYTKEIEAYPGEAAASSILFRLSNDQGSILSNSCETQDLVRQLCTWRDLMAVIALAEKVPATPTDICSTIAQADLDADSFNLNSSLPSPSPVVYSHLDDFYHLIHTKLGNFEDIFTAILQKCLGLNGRCPIYAFNYALLAKSNLKLSQSNRLVLKQNGFKNSKQTRKASRRLFVEKFSCKSPVYHNCRIYANDGRLLCYCDQRKLEWYLHRELAKLVDDNPPAIMLLFEPKGRPEDEGNDFYIQSKKNICVGCGEGDHYLRYRIIPSCYRMHFPEHLKSHRSHDIVLLCVDCHEVAHAAAEKYKKEIAAEFGIPLFIHKVADSGKEEVTLSAAAMNFEKTGVSPLQLRTAAMALLRHGQRMPFDRREELTQIVMRYYGGREISEEDLEKALLVGMSTRERRRLEKKKGLSLNHSTATALPDKGRENYTGGIAKSATVGGAEVNNADSSYPTKSESFQEEDDGDLLTVIESNVSNIPTSSDTRVDQVHCSSKNTNSYNSEIFDARNYCNGDEDIVDNNCESGDLRNGNLDLLEPISDGSGSQKHNPKLSLLGHGPHGKQVVGYLMQEYGEQGIRQFCQRWRQVFVEAVHPRFLPAGWDIMHSGRREFGEFSVYNPAKKTADAAKPRS